MTFPPHPVLFIVAGALWLAAIIVAIALARMAARHADERELFDLTVERELIDELPAPVYPIAMQRARRNGDRAHRNGIGRPR